MSPGDAVRPVAVAIDPANPDPSKWCSSCGHLWSKHGTSLGCAARVDSAWTATNDRPCGCSATHHDPPIPGTRAAREREKEGT